MDDVFRAPVGTRDVLPPESTRWLALVSQFAQQAKRFGYALVITPEFEHLEVLQRAGETTEVVRKEMYDFLDKGGRHIALRPEGTAPVVRVFVQHRPTVPWKVWYYAPMFRYERPQKGRYRQHYQFGIEVLGVDDPAADAEVIAFAHSFFTDLGLRKFRLLINSMGDTSARAAHRDALRKYFGGFADRFDAEFAQRIEENPVRLLDSKQPELQEVLSGAPELPEFLSEESQANFKSVQAELDAQNIAYEIAPRIVRGLDYYTGVTFEFVSDAIEASQSTICGGGRYDQLAAEMGGPDTPGIGFGMGIDRTLLACDAEGVFPGPGVELNVFVIDALGGTEATEVCAELRAAGLNVDRAYGARSVKAQWKLADRSKALYGVMIATEESGKGAVAVKNMETGEQAEVARTELVEWLRSRS